jgi:type IV pilus assembly protein PilB
MLPNFVAAIEYGGFINWWAAIPFLVLLLFWTRLLTWIDKDSKRNLMPQMGINAGLLVGLVLAIMALFFLPGFGPAFGAFAGIFLVEVATYLGLRAQKVGLADLKDELSNEFLSSFKFGGKGPRKSKKEKGALMGELILVGKGGRNIPLPDDEDPTRPSFEAVQGYLNEPFMKEAQTIEIFPAGETSSSRYWIDGIAYEGAKQDKAVTAEAISYLKSQIGLDVDERRKPQSGILRLAFSGKKHELRVSTSGNSAGESVRMEIDVPARYMKKAEELGFTADQLEALTADLYEPGIVLLAASKGHGLTALQYGMVRMHDAFTSHILTIERDPPMEMEGITQNKLAAGASPAEEAKQVSWVCSQEPDILVSSPVESAQAARELIRFAANGKRAYIGVRAADAFEAVEQWRKLVGDDELALSQVRTVIAGKLFRKLCDATKVPYAPDEKLLRQLGMHPGKVTELYKPGEGPIIDAKGNEIPDTICWGIGYKGRFGVYEMFGIDDEARTALRGNGGGSGQSVMKQLFRKQKRRYIQELALNRVELGDTSVKEYLRVLKPGAEQPAAKPAAPAQTPPRK